MPVLCQSVAIYVGELIVMRMDDWSEGSDCVLLMDLGQTINL